uniref:Integrase catalytic domain-containing protein n=1 Tax=Strongyloides stercoralis TaxID=6248 RepID=A0A0K0E4Z4_STRER
MLYLYGALQVARIDNAQTFASSTFIQELKLLKIQVKFGLPYNSNSQTLIERVFGTLTRILVKLQLDDENINWAKELQHIAFVLNTTCKDGTLASSKFMLLPEENMNRADKRIEQIILGTLKDDEESKIKRQRGVTIKIGDLIRVKKNHLEKMNLSMVHYQ